MEVISKWTSFINYFSENSGFAIFLELLIALITAGIFFGIYFLTKKYAKSTRDLAEETKRSVKISEESIRLTKEKERIDRTLNFINEFDKEKFNNLFQQKYHKITKHRELDRSYKKDIIPILSFLDTIALFYLKGKLDEDIFNAKFEGHFLNFFSNFRNDKSVLAKDKKTEIYTFYGYVYFLRLMKEILEKKIKYDPNIKIDVLGIDPKISMKDILITNLEECKKLLKRE